MGILGRTVGRLYSLEGSKQGDGGWGVVLGSLVSGRGAWGFLAEGEHIGGSALAFEGEGLGQWLAWGLLNRAVG